MWIVSHISPLHSKPHRLFVNSYPVFNYEYALNLILMPAEKSHSDVAFATNMLFPGRKANLMLIMCPGVPKSCLNNINAKGD